MDVTYFAEIEGQPIDLRVLADDIAGQFGEVALEFGFLNEREKPKHRTLAKEEADIIRAVQATPTSLGGLDHALFAGCDAKSEKMLAKALLGMTSSGKLFVSRTGAASLKVHDKQIGDTPWKAPEKHTPIRDLTGPIVEMLTERGPRLKSQIARTVDPFKPRDIRTSLLSLIGDDRIEQIAPGVFALKGTLLRPGLHLELLAEDQRERDRLIEPSGEPHPDLSERGRALARALRPNKIYADRILQDEAEAAGLWPAAVEELRALRILNAKTFGKQTLLRAVPNRPELQRDPAARTLPTASVRSLSITEVACFVLSVIGYQPQGCVVGTVISMSAKYGRQIGPDSVIAGFKDLQSKGAITQSIKAVREDGPRPSVTTSIGDSLLEAIHLLEDERQADWRLIDEGDVQSHSRP